jgi:aryl-alcohol dehydrogenase-like predicted oxidoreductase
VKFIFGLDKIHRLHFASQRQQLLSAAIDSGVNGFDVAPSYGNGLCEYELGLFLSRNASLRKKLEINTKFGIPFSAYGPASRHIFLISRVVALCANKVFKKDLQRQVSPKSIEQSLDASLKRLRIEKIDTYFLHEPYELINDDQLHELKNCLDALITSGKICKYGISGENAVVDVYSEKLNVQLIQKPIDLSGSINDEKYVYHILNYLKKNNLPGTKNNYIKAATSVNASGFLYSTTSPMHLSEFVGS